MTKENKHTPAPWAITPKGNLVKQSLPEYPTSGTYLGVNINDMTDIDANHIVKCVNSHDELLEALELCVMTIENFYFHDLFENAYSASVKAIKKAKGET